MVAEEDAPLLSALKAKRRALAESAGRAGLHHLHRPDPDRDGRAQARDAGRRWRGSAASARRSWKATAAPSWRSSPARRTRCTRRGASWPGGGRGDVFDRLAEAQAGLARGEDGTDKPMTCDSATLRRIAERRPHSLDDLARLPGVGEQKAERFGPAFLDVLEGEDAAA